MLNKVILIGNTTKDVEIHTTSSGKKIGNLDIAVQRDFKNSNGERETDFFKVVLFEKQAELCFQYLKKGNKIAVTGKLQNRTYEGNDGVKRTVTEVIAESVEFLTPRENKAESETTSVKKTRPQLEPIQEDMDLPF